MAQPFSLVSSAANSSRPPSLRARGVILRGCEDLRAGDSEGGEEKGLLPPGSLFLSDLPSGDCAHPGGRAQKEDMATEQAEARSQVSSLHLRS